MKGKNMIDLNKTQRELNEVKDFVQSAEYCVTEPGFSNFNKDEIISHKDLLIYLSKNPLNTIATLPHCSM
jgi:hypothetical protein|tara:strand:- start:498 stop:707 length:210 start_codon:yes stop_codon:yes gene_type:complete